MLVVVVVLAEGKVAGGVAAAIVVGMLNLLLVWLVVLVYYLPFAFIRSGGCGVGDNAGSGVSSCSSGNWFWQNYSNFEMS